MTPIWEMKNNAETALYACMVPSYDAIQPWIHFAWKKKRNRSGRAKKNVIIIAVCVGFLLFVVLSIIAIVYCVRRRRQQDKQNEEAAQLEQVSEAEDGNESPHEEDALG